MGIHSAIALKAKNPNARLFTIRIGYDVAVAFGGNIERVISQYTVRVEHHVKTAPDRWLLSEYTDPSTILTLSSFDLQLSIADLYENIEFEDI